MDNRNGQDFSQIERNDGLQRQKRKREKTEEKHKHKHKHKKSKRHTREASSPIVQEEEEGKWMQAKHIGKIFIEEIEGLTPERAFCLDRKADHNILQYLSIYKTHVARYYRYGCGCLGLEPNEEFLIEGNKKKQRKDRDEHPRYYDRKHRKILAEKFNPTGSSKVERVRCFADVDPSYVPISRNPSLKTKANPLGIYDSSTEQFIQTYSSLDSEAHAAVGMVESGRTQEGDISSMEDSSSWVQHDSHLAKMAEFNKYLNENPHDITRWLEFVDFQDGDANEAHSSTTQSMEASSEQKVSGNALVEIKCSVLDRAIEKNPAAVELQLKQLELRADVWPPEQLERSWEQLIFKYPNRPEVWWGRLLFLQSSVHLFTIGRLIKAYASCLSTLASLRDGTFKSHRAPPNIEEHMLGILHQLLRLLQQAGHTEKALAILQASVEVNLFAPAALADAPLATRLEFLESFWDSGKPRSGEVGALGFNTWVDRSGQVPYCTAYQQEAEIKAEDSAVDEAASRAEGWLALELSRSARHVFPWRPDINEGQSDEDCEDLERVVMLSDISSCVILLTLEGSRLGLVKTYLDMLGIQDGQCSSLSRPVTSERACCSNIHDLCQIVPLPPLVPSALITSPIPCALYQSAGDLLVQVLTARLFSGHAATFLNLTLMSVRRHLLGQAPAEGESIKDWKRRCKELRKNSKAMLKEEENRNNILLFTSYINLEWSLGGAADGRRLLYATLATLTAPSAADIKPTYNVCVWSRLYRRGAELELGINQADSDFKHGATLLVTEEQRANALQLLCGLASGQPPRPMSSSPSAPCLLRARQAYQSTLVALLQRRGDEETIDHGGVLRLLPQSGTLLGHWVACYAYLQYLTHGLQAALEVLSQATNEVQQRLDPKSARSDNRPEDKSQRDEEMLYYRFAYQDLVITQGRLLHRHLTTGIIPLSCIRSPLQGCLHLLPDSPLLLCMYTHLEATTSIVGRLRRYLLKLTCSCQTPLVWIYGALTEIARRLRSTQTEKMEDWMVVSQGPPGTQHQLRAWFERAVQHPSGCHSALLWRLYFYFEVNDGDPLRAKAVYYRGLSRCPASKALCMDFARAFPDHLEEVTDLMLEKELRLRTPLEEIDVLLPQYKPQVPSVQEDDMEEEEQEPNQQSISSNLAHGSSGVSNMDNLPEFENDNGAPVEDAASLKHEFPDDDP